MLAIYACGAAFGNGLGIFLGGTILSLWHGLWPDASLAPFGLKGWQAAFMIVGLPGLLVALWVTTVREPVRGLVDGITHRAHPHPFRETGTVLMSMLPLANLWVLWRSGGGMRSVAVNLALGIITVVAVYSLILFTGSVTQWTALGIGIYAALSWAQTMAIRDPVVLGMIFRCKALMYLSMGGALGAFGSVGIGFWSFSYYQRFFGVSVAEVGSVLGVGSAVVGVIGTLVGGVISDRLRQRSARGKVYLPLVGTILVAVFAVILLLSPSVLFAYAASLLMVLVGAFIGVPVTSTLNDLVLPRGRAVTTAFFLMFAAFVSALGPYTVGRVSDHLAVLGADPGNALRLAMFCGVLAAIIAAAFFIMALKHVATDEASLKERARSLGEKI